MALPNEHADPTVFFHGLAMARVLGCKLQLAGHWIRVIGMKQTGNRKVSHHKSQK